ncbi:hypothetical protein M0804_008776 [Polistes exclamans]|nr:hypothetical protein M0804_008776 [Polistes exclamans]
MFTDLLVGLISVLTDIIWRTTVTWHAGNIACKLIRFMQAVVTYSSTYVLVALSIDRYDAITRPMNFSGSWWRARVLVVVAWSLSALFSVPIIFLYEEKRIQGMKQCWIDLGSPIQWRIYMSLVSFTLFIAPTLIIGGCYMVIVATIWSQGSALRQGPTRDTRRASSRGLIPRAKIKTVKMTFVIVFDKRMFYKKECSKLLMKMVKNCKEQLLLGRNMQAISWVSGWCTANPHHCFGTGGAKTTSTRTTVTTSLTAHSSRKSGPGMLHSTTSRKHVMVSLV